MYVDYGGVLVNHFVPSAVPSAPKGGLNGSTLAPQTLRLSTTPLPASTGN